MRTSASDRSAKGELGGRGRVGEERERGENRKEVGEESGGAGEEGVERR